MVSQKISEFNVSTSLNNSDLFTFVVNGTNKNISYSDFKLSLGVTGTLSQAGDPLAAPVLDKVGDNYNIRNIESSKGVMASVSAQNGVAVGANFAQGNVGVPVIENLNADQYLFKSLEAGTNISIEDHGNHIEIGFNPTAGSSKTVVVSTIDDFPEAVSGVINLVADTDYLIAKDITTGNRFVVANPNTIRAASSQMVTLEYTGAGDMFTGVDPNFKTVNITVSAPNGNIFNTTSPLEVGIVQMVESNIEVCQNIGSMDGNFITRFTNVAFENIAAGGITFSGTNNTLFMDVGVAFLGGGSLVDLGTATFNTVSISGGNIVESAPGTFFLSGAANSANINSGGLGSVINNSGFGSGGPLSGITVDDVRWKFLANNNIPDSVSDGLMWVEGSSTETVIAAAGAPVKVTNTWTQEDISRFTFDSSGRLTYIGERSARLPIDVTSTILMATGTDRQVSMCIAINGSVITPTCKQATANNSKAASVTTIWQHDFTFGDYVEVFVSNEDNTVNLIVQQAIMRVN